MTARLGRRKAQQWLAPLRKTLRDMRHTGETLEADGHLVMEMPDAYIRIDHCIDGFARMIARVLPDAGIAAVYRLRDMIGTQQEMTIADVDAALAEINKIEPLIARVTTCKIKDAVLTESIAIDLEMLGRVTA